MVYDHFFCFKELFIVNYKYMLFNLTIKNTDNSLDILLVSESTLVNQQSDVYINGLNYQKRKFVSI